MEEGRCVVCEVEEGEAKEGEAKEGEAKTEAAPAEITEAPVPEGAPEGTRHPQTRIDNILQKC